MPLLLVACLQEGFYGAAEEVDLPFLQGGSQQQQGLGWQKRLA